MPAPITAAVLLAFLALGGCGDSRPPPAAEPRGVFDTQLQAIDKAKGVEKTLQDQADAQRKAIEDAERR